MSGEPVALRGFVLAGGHLVEATYEADVTDPANVQVIVSVTAGMGDCTIIDPKTPTDAMNYFKGLANELNTEASGTSFLDSFGVIADASAAWIELRKAVKDQQEGEDCGSLWVCVCRVAGGTSGGVGGLRGFAVVSLEASSKSTNMFSARPEAPRCTQIYKFS
jgi:hypothetical protein